MQRNGTAYLKCSDEQCNEYGNRNSTVDDPNITDSYCGVMECLI
jgi:hypothetical protein